MTARENLRQMLAQRRQFPRHSAEWNWRTRAARKYVWIILGLPTTEWSD